MINVNIWFSFFLSIAYVDSLEWSRQHNAAALFFYLNCVGSLRYDFLPEYFFFFRFL